MYYKNHQQFVLVHWPQWTDKWTLLQLYYKISMNIVPHKIAQVDRPQHQRYYFLNWLDRWKQFFARSLPADLYHPNASIRHHEDSKWHINRVDLMDKQMYTISMPMIQTSSKLHHLDNCSDKWFSFHRSLRIPKI